MLFSASLLGLPVSSISETLPAMLTSGVVLSFIGSVVLYAKGNIVERWRLNPNGNSGECDIAQTWLRNKKKIITHPYLEACALEVITLVLCSTQLSTKFIPLINFKMLTIFCISTFISSINTSYESLKARNAYLFQRFSMSSSNFILS